MRLTLLLSALSAPVLLLACSMGPFARLEVLSSPARRGLAEALLENIHCDGEALSGRLLLSATDQGLLLDQRLIEAAYLTTEAVSACETGQPLPFVVMDVYAKPPDREELLLLKPGYWYGKNVRIPLFTKSTHGDPSPTCIEVELAFRALDGAPLAPIRIRAQCLPRPEGRPDAASNTKAADSSNAGETSE
ncbi:hypothetical protein [Stigmatella aurantiaca]|uniref:Lipoprotein n=1 Tax=Stigmatella aurantiaca (strain DW4/3-1) TaxID=378806 RepID=E3FHX2_STIAD|nr:hypothetical protein [Stigmatella aurantiaca]ADO71578.1 uncharacterized protein STAUR_3790 [Stigmatella aurantiaca DW4/3-1]